MSVIMWKKMYLTLVSGIIEASEIMPMLVETAAVQERLNKALQDAEEIYISAEEEPEKG